MISFQEIRKNIEGPATEITEGKYPLWLRFFVVAQLAAINSLNTKIQNETDVLKAVQMLGEQNAKLGQITGLSVAIGSSDKRLLQRLRRGLRLK